MSEAKSEIEDLPAIRDFLSPAEACLQAIAEELRKAYPRLRTNVLRTITDTRYFTLHLAVSWPERKDDQNLGLDLCLSFYNLARQAPSFEAHLVLDDDQGTLEDVFHSGDILSASEENLAELLADLPRMAASLRGYVAQRMAGEPPPS